MRIDRIIAILLAVLVSALLVRADGINVQYSLKSKVVTITRDLTAGTGSVAYTGVGFVPTVCLTAGTVGASVGYTTYLGVSDSGLVQGMVGSANNGGASITTTSQNTTAFIREVNSSAFTDLQTGTVTSYDADGFTISWVKTGSPTGTMTAYVLCLR